MRRIALLAACAALVAGPALAQSSTMPHHRGTSMREPGSHRPSRSPGPPVDRGAQRADADRAYMGGGMILEGAPGAPAPMPRATPPGQTPANMVPMR